MDSEETILRRVLETISVAALLAVWIFTAWWVVGPHPLPSRFPIHFDLSGHANGWGSPGMLWMMPAIVTVVYGLMTFVARRPGSFNYPVRATPATRPRLERLATGMILWLKTEIVLLFAGLQYATIESARSGTAPKTLVSVPIAIAVVWITIGWFVVAMVRTGRVKPRVR